jgi:multidrug resistance efflux pump
LRDAGFNLEAALADDVAGFDEVRPVAAWGIKPPTSWWPKSGAATSTTPSTPPASSSRCTRKSCPARASRVAKVHAKPGQQVKGELLLELDDREIRLALEALQEQLAQQENRILG